MCGDFWLGTKTRRNTIDNYPGRNVGGENSHLLLETEAHSSMRSWTGNEECMIELKTFASRCRVETTDDVSLPFGPAP